MNFANNQLFDVMWREFCAQEPVRKNPKDFVRWILDKFQNLGLINDGIAVMTSAQEIVWSSKQFQTWFPKAADPDLQMNVLGVMDSPMFLSDEADSTNPRNPFSEFQLTGKPASGVIQTAKGNIFEIAVQGWSSPNIEEPFMLLNVHDATERRELRNKLKNLHQMCDLCSHIDFLQEQKDPKDRENFVIEGIQYMAKSLLHYEFLEVRTYDPVTNTLPLCTHYGLLKEAERRVIHAKLTGNGTIGYVAVTRQAYICRDTETDPYYLRGGETARSSVTVPILFQGELLGILNAESSQPDAFQESDQLYAEIFAHEIALAMNFMRVLVTEQKMGSLMTAEEIHGSVALPISKIMEQAAELGKYLGEEQIEAQHELYKIMKNALFVKNIIQSVGVSLDPTDLVAPPDRKELVAKWFNEFFGKRILLVDPSEELYKQAKDLFKCLECEVDWAPTGKNALNMLKVAIWEKRPYWIILASIRQPDYKLSTQFFLDLGKIYGRKHPPLVLLQEVGSYDMDHTIVNVRTRYPASGQTGKPLPEARLLEVIHRTIIRLETVKPCFMRVASCYSDPLAQTPLQRLRKMRILHLKTERLKRAKQNLQKRRSRRRRK